MNLEILRKLGLTEGEIRVYLALLSLGQTSVGKIIDKAKISGSKVYVILEKLIQKGLVSFVMKEKTKYFQASEPKRLLIYLEEKEKELKGMEDELKTSIQEFSTMLESKEKGLEASVYQGWDGVKTALYSLHDSLSSGEEYLIFSASTEELNDSKMIAFFKNIHAKRLEKSIRCRILSNIINKVQLKDFSKIRLCEVRLTSITLPTETLVYKEGMLIINYRSEPSAVFIKSKRLSEDYTKFFENLWTDANKLKK